MNKLTKVGVSALCGTLASFSLANAGDLAITGGVDATWATKSGGSNVTGSTFGINKNFTLSASGELDNGYAWNYFSAQNDEFTGVDSSSVGLTIDGLGKIETSYATAGSMTKALDQTAPTAWEEPDNGMTNGPNKIVGASTGAYLMYTTEADMLPMSGQVKIVYAKETSGGLADSGAQNAGGDQYGSAIDVGFSITPVDGLVIRAAHAETENQSANANLAGEDDLMESGADITYTAGSFKIGYNRTIEQTNLKSIRQVEYYDNRSYGVTFAVNDNLTVGYTVNENERVYGYSDNDADDTQTTLTDVEMKSTGISASYNIGGATISVQHNSTDNPGYSTTATDEEWTAVKLGMAF